MPVELVFTMRGARVITEWCSGCIGRRAVAKDTVSEYTHEMLMARIAELERECEDKQRRLSEAFDEAVDQEARHRKLREAAERVLEHVTGGRFNADGYCTGCAKRWHIEPRHRHTDDCPWVDLDRALAEDKEQHP